MVQADASDVAVAAVVLQANEEGNLQPCAYTSHKLNETECKWAVWAVAYHSRSERTIKIWRLSKHHVSSHLSKSAGHYISDAFNFQLKYIPGGRNFLADALSCMPQFASDHER